MYTLWAVVKWTTLALCGLIMLYVAILYLVPLVVAGQIMWTYVDDGIRPKRQAIPTLSEARERWPAPSFQHGPEDCLQFQSEGLERFVETQACANGIRHKYFALFERYPNVLGVHPGFLRDKNGHLTERIGLIVLVTKEVAEDRISPGNRIPDVLDGVPIEVRETREGAHFW